MPTARRLVIGVALVWSMLAGAGPVALAATETPVQAEYQMWQYTLGAQTVAEQPVPGRTGATVTGYQNGEIYYSPATGAHAVAGEHLTRWKAGGGIAELGLPTNSASLAQPKSCIPTYRSCVQTFEKGALSQDATAGKHLVKAPLVEAWKLQGYQKGSLGYPVAEQVCGLADGGCRQAFTNGTIYWSAQSGAKAMATPILERYLATGGAKGPLGAVGSGAACALAGGGCYQQFANGDIYWSAGTGAKILIGGIRSTYLRVGAQDRLGYPLADEVCGLVEGGCYQHFQRGSIYWSPANGGHPVWGAIMTRWGTLQYERGFGYPTGDEICGLRDGGCLQRFTKGLIYWSGASGAHPVMGAILQKYIAANCENGWLGYPTSGEFSYGAGVRQNFQRGSRTFYWGWNPDEQFHGPVTRITPERGGGLILPGWNGTRVKLVQQRFGIYRTGSGVTFDAATQRAVANFQRSRGGLRTDGIVDLATWQAMGIGWPFDIDAWQPPVDAPWDAGRQRRIDTAVGYAWHQIGSQYTWGGVGPYALGTDCSGLTLASLYAAGLDPQPITVLKHAEPLYRTSNALDQDPRMLSVPISQIERGDLVFWTSGGRVVHVALYIGDGQIIESIGAGVRQRSLYNTSGSMVLKGWAKRPFL